MVEVPIRFAAGSVVTGEVPASDRFTDLSVFELLSCGRGKLPMSTARKHRLRAS